MHHRAKISSKSINPLWGYCDLSTFQYGGCRHLGFLKSSFLADWVWRDEMDYHVKFPQNWSMHCRNIVMFQFFKMAATAMLDFKIHNFYWHIRSRESSCINVPNLIKIAQSVAEILQFYLLFKMSAAAILDVRNSQILSAGGFWVAKMHHHAKFRQNSSIVQLSRFFDISRWRPSAIVDLFGTYLDHPRRVLGGLYHYTKFGCNRCISFENMKV